MTNKENSSSPIKGVNLPKLAEDGSNWVLYQERLENAVTAMKGLRRHLQGTMCKLEAIEQRSDRDWQTKESTQPLTLEEVDKHEEAVDLYKKQEAQVCKFIYRTVDLSTIIQIKGSNAAKVWKQLIAIHAQKGDMFQTDPLNKLQTMRYIDGNDMRTHLGAMKGI